MPVLVPTWMVDPRPAARRGDGNVQAMETIAATPEGHELFAHQADIGVRGWGPSREKAFEQVAMALTSAIVDPRQVEAREPVGICCEAPDDEILLVDWLNALIYQMATMAMLFGRFEVQIRDHRLEATAWGEPIDPAKHRPAVEIKGATFTEVAVRRLQDGRWLAQCVVDV